MSYQRVEAALRAFWAGRPEPMDRLIAGLDGGPPYVARMLMEAFGLFARSQAERRPQQGDVTP